MKIRLETTDGMLVHEEEIPEFKLYHPDVVSWGFRMFQFYNLLKVRPPVHVYRECFHYAIPLPNPHGVNISKPTQKELEASEQEDHSL